MRDNERAAMNDGGAPARFRGASELPVADDGRHVTMKGLT